MRAKALVKMAFEDMMRKSQASAIPKPAPAAAPGKDAIVGLGILYKRPEVARWYMRCRLMASSTVTVRAPSLRAAIAFTSPPAQKPLPPPVTTTQRTSELDSAYASCAANASSNSNVNALRASGRFKVIVSTPSSIEASN